MPWRCVKATCRPARARNTTCSTPGHSRKASFPTPGARQRLLDAAEQTLALALAVQNQPVILKTRRTLAALLANDPAQHHAALRHLEGCVELASTIRQPVDEAACAWLQASMLQSTDPGWLAPHKCAHCEPRSARTVR